MKRTLLSLLLALCLVIGLLPFGAAAAAEVTEGPLTFSIENGEAAVCACESDYTLWEVDIPETVQGVPVTAIADRAFAGSYAKRVVFPRTLKTIGERAFDNAQLKWADLSGTQVRVLPRSAFDYCQHLLELQLPETLQEIGERCFTNCHELTAVTIPDAVTTIGDSAFLGCTSLEEVRFPASLETIGTEAFSLCSALRQARLPAGTRTIGERAYDSCHSLTDLLLPDSVQSIGQWAFCDCDRLEEVRIPAHLQEIPHECFRDCNSLRVVLIPASVKTIAETAFDFCWEMQELYFAGTEAQLRSTLSLDYVQDYSGLAIAQVYLMNGYPDAYYGLFDLPAEDNWAYEGIAFCLDAGLMNGVGDGRFDPEGTATRAQVVTILWRMCGEPEAAQPLPFKDCGISWADPAIAWASENGIVKGLGQGRFGPNAPVTREQLVTIFHRFCGEYLKLDVSARQSLSAFPDAGRVSAWAQDAMQWGIAVQLIAGSADRTGTYLQPGGSATRAQIARILLNFVSNVLPE